MRQIIVLLALALVALLSLVPVVGAEGERAGGTLVDGAGRAIGRVQLEQLASGVRLDVTFQGVDVVKPGEHGIHLHAVGKCDGPDFTTAGGHFNPNQKQHGLENPAGPHAGDLPNLTVDANQQGFLSGTAAGAALSGRNAASLRRPGGTALVIHATADDLRTDPSGNSGARIACGVVTPEG